MTTPIEQLEAMRRLQEGWDGYGAAAPQTAVIDLAGEFVALVAAMMKSAAASQSIPVHVTPTRVGGVLIDWQDALMQHEIDIAPDRSLSFLHLNKATGQIEV